MMVSENGVEVRKQPPPEWFWSKGEINDANIR